MKKDIDIQWTPEELAEAFSEMNDEDQAQFFIEAAKVFESWGSGNRIEQAYRIGRHLGECSCSTFEARQLVKDIANGIE